MINVNAFLYIIAFLFTLITTALITRRIIPFLKSRAKQPIYEEGPSWHISKSGTPTMGGLGFTAATALTLSLASLYMLLSDKRSAALSIIICLVYALLNALIGITDDITKLKHKKNAGLTPRAKLILQFLASGVFLIARIILLNEGTKINLLFGTVNLGIAYCFLSMIILVGITNCANLTDGIDGLASAVAFGIGVSVFYMSYQKYEAVGFICAAIIGSALGFLIFNVHPAKIFMGDTGSLFLGAIIATLAFELQNPLIAIGYGGIYVIEGVSVILQVVYFKLTRKRLFKMAPIHHHLEKCGWDETKICLCAIILTLLFSIPIALLL